MLNTLSIHNFALVHELELEFGNGMTVITGETGAGKSILLDALGLTLGQRAEADFVRRGAEKADISATFRSNPAARSWLSDHDLPEDDDIILRRVISTEGRSRGYINGRPVSAGDLRELASCLISVHSQNAHQRLLEKDAPRQILDAYAGLQEDTVHVGDLWRQWQSARKQLRSLQENSSELQAQRQLLEYQVYELRDLELQDGELDELEAEQKRLAGAENTQMSGHRALMACDGSENDDPAASSLVHQALQQLDQIDDQHPLLDECRELLSQAAIQLEEAGDSLQRYLSLVDINPHRLSQVEQRLSDIYSMARKHHIKAEMLYTHWQAQEESLAALQLSDGDLDHLEAAVAELQNAYDLAAGQLSDARRAAAETMDRAIESHFADLSLGRACFSTRIESGRAGAEGRDDIQFMVQTNPGLPEGPLQKVASGGELSRISLAIQVVTAATSAMPCLIFDEVDVGIGGGTAERVGRLMRNIGSQAQVMCVTHQPQVAAQAHQHYQVNKVSGDDATHTRIRLLDSKQRSEELARMLGGVEITRQTLAHAREMLNLAAAQ